jgi:hypothetical protein
MARRSAYLDALRKEFWIPYNCLAELDMLKIVVDAVADSQTVNRI